MKFLLDTNIISESIKPKPNPGVLKFLNEVPVNSLYLSVLTIGEIRKGIEKLKANPQKLQSLQLWLDKDLLHFFAGRVMNINVEIADKWGFLLGNIKDPVPAIDSLIAATAMCNNLTLVTRNTADFTRFSIETINPFN